MSWQKSSPARAHEGSGEIRDGVSRLHRAAGLSVDTPAPIDPAQAEHQEPADRDPAAHARDCAHSDPLRLPADPYHVEAGRLGRRAEPDLPAVSGGGPDSARQATEAAQDVGPSPGQVPAEACERGLEPGLRRGPAQQRAKVPSPHGRCVFSREGLAIEVGQRLRGAHVVQALNRLVAERGAPKYLFADNGAEFTGHLVDLWAYHHGTRIDFSRPGKPTDNAHIETFNGSLRDECLNVHWFATIEEAKMLIEARRRDYNESRPHMALGNIPPREYALQAGASSSPTGLLEVES
jgi:Integrase core domain